MGNWKQFITERFWEGLVAGSLDALKNGVKDAGEKAIKEAIISPYDEKRGEMMAFIRGLVARDRIASDNLVRRQRDRQFCRPQTYGKKESYKPGDEITFERLLTKLYIALSAADERVARVETFVWLGRMEDEDFDATLPALADDKLIQWIKRGFCELKGLYDKVKTALPEKEKVAEGLKNADKKISKQLDSWADQLEARYRRR